ncbi:MAG TPA: ATP-binding cassette domain-containing protein [Streptosporangiaceae bacterium]|nr:ATP-binding cassette domain-containing protein [Streptosporangiaceae bacterium]
MTATGEAPAAGAQRTQPRPENTGRPQKIRSRPVYYGPIARFTDWYHGWRDGRAGIPARPRPGSEPTPKLGVPRKIVTTAHREALIRAAQGGFTREKERLERSKADAEDQAAAILVRRNWAQEAVDRAEATVMEVAQPLTEAERLRRRLGEEARPDKVVVQRRLREQQRQVAAARAAVSRTRQNLADIEAESAATANEIRQHSQIARTRLLRIHVHAHRRLAAYRRSLIHAHRHGVWLNDAMGITQPELPLWGFPPPLEPAEPKFRSPIGATDDDTEHVEEQTADEIPLEAQLVFGSEPESSPEPFYFVAEAAPRHFILTRDGDKIRLRYFGPGNGPYIDGVEVKDAWLRPEDYFDFFGNRYQVSADGSALEVYPLLPAALVVYDLGAKTKQKVRLAGMSFVQQQNHMLAILGPSGAGKTSLFSALVGELQPEEGDLYLGKLPLRTHGAQIREQLGFVPQDETLFKTFTVRQLLRYAYELRGKGSKSARDTRVEEVCDLLGINEQIDQLIGTLSGGQRKRVSISVELLSKPSLLMLDEPTSGLDAGMDLEVLMQLRKYAEQGNTVMVITHSTEHLRQAHRVLVVAHGGRPVYFGSSRRLLKQLGAKNYAELMKKLTKEPDSLVDAYQRGPAVIEARAEAERVARELPEADSTFTPRSPALTGLRQFFVLFRRQVALIRTRGRGSPRSDTDHWFRPAIGFVTVVAPLLIAAVGACLAGLVSGSDGLGRVSTAGAHTAHAAHVTHSARITHAAHASHAPHTSHVAHAAVHAAQAVPAIQGSTSAATALSLLITLSMLTGQALTYSDIVNDYLTIRREHRTGTFTLPVMTAKWLVFGVIAVVQALLITWIYVMFRPGPSYSLLLGHVSELFVDLAAMSVAAMTLGLLISAVMRKLEQAIAVVTGVSIAQIALNGVASNLSTNPTLNAISMLLPSRWGLSAAAASVNLRGISPTATADALWHHTVLQWGIDIGGLCFLTAVYFVLACRILATRLNKPD